MHKNRSQEEIDGSPIQKKESTSDTKSFSDLKALLRNLSGFNLRLAQLLPYSYIFSINYAEFPISGRHFKTLDSREMEEISSALIPLNSLVNTGLPEDKETSITHPIAIFSTNLLTYESSRLQLTADD